MKNHCIFVLTLINDHLILQLSTERLKCEVKGQLTEFDEQPLPLRPWRTAPPSVSLPPFLHHHPDGGTKQRRHTFNGLFITRTRRVNPQQRGPESIWEGKTTVVIMRPMTPFVKNRYFVAVRGRHRRLNLEALVVFSSSSRWNQSTFLRADSVRLPSNAIREICSSATAKTDSEILSKCSY